MSLNILGAEPAEVGMWGFYGFTPALGGFLHLPLCHLPHSKHVLESIKHIKNIIQ